MKEQKLTATTPLGVFTRTTAREYRFVIVATDLVKGGFAYRGKFTQSAWSATKPLAEKRAAEYRRDGYQTVGVFPVDEPAAAPAPQAAAPAPAPAPAPLASIAKTREEWLIAATRVFGTWFEKLSKPLPEKLRVSVGWTSKGARSNRIGECWARICSQDGATEIFIAPSLERPARILDVLLHELVHAALDLKGGHGREFKRLATALGLLGPMKATTASDALKARIDAEVLPAIGAFPGALLTNAGASSAPKKQTTRLLKVECSECGYIARVTSKWIEDVGAPLCPCNQEPMEVAQ